MARYQPGNFGFKTLVEYDVRDPIRNLWRNVLVVALEDAIKIKNKTLKFSEFYSNKRFHELDYVSLPNRDFDGVCQLAQLDGNLVRKKVNKFLKEMEDNYGKNKKNMPEMPWKRLYNGFSVGRQSDGTDTPMSTM
jgi:hypothetical protein